MASAVRQQDRPEVGRGQNPASNAPSRRQEDVEKDGRALQSAEEGVKPDNALAHQSSEAILPPGYVLTRIIVNFAFYFSWLPYIILVLARENNFYEALIFGVAFSGFCVVFNIGMLAFGLKREFPYILDMAFVLFFSVFLGVHMHHSHYTQALITWELPAVHFWLCLVFLVTIAARYPFTIQYAKEQAPEEAWNAQSFRDVCDHLAGLWAAGMGMTGLLCVAPAKTERNTGRQALNVIFNYIWPMLMLILLIICTRMYPSLIRTMYYIPRLLRNTVKPEGTPAGTGNGSADGKQPAAGNTAAGAAGNTSAGATGNTATAGQRQGQAPSGVVGNTGQGGGVGAGAGVGQARTGTGAPVGGQKAAGTPRPGTAQPAAAPTPGGSRPVSIPSAR